MAPKNNKVAFSVWQGWFFQQFPNWEEIIDPNNPLHQIAVQSAIHEMANLVSDRAVRDGIQSTAKKSIASIAQKNAKD
jgi:hypothetical protein